MKNLGKVDIVLAGTVMLLIMLGQLMVFSASSMFAKAAYGSLTYFFQKQLLWGLICLVIMITVSRFDYRKLMNEKTAMVLIAVTILLLVGVLFFGRTIKGATRWYSLGLMNFQPSEIAKIAVIIYLSHKLSRKGIDKLDFKEFLMPIYLVLSLILFLVFIQPDLSTTLMIMGIAAIMLFISRVKQSYLLYTSFAFIPPALFMLINGNNYQMRRIKDWVHSLGDPLMAAHQVKQSIIGIGRGGLVGNGMGESKQKLFFLPDSHTDFIFSIIGEEFGFIGASVILILFMVILVRGLRIARNAPEGFGQFLALGITLNIVLYAFTNVAVVTNLFPATGLPMPFVSYGGSHMLFMGISTGLLLNVSRSIKHGSANTNPDDSSARGRLGSAILEVD
ncbi:MAG: putative lipid II flippase FtsW [Calditrichaeota bacterium]|nr:MAG: putative lipid II flippase FtsW [Calditrichota bacterium]MBL1206556.1 putative lipid II flippase FtsW [Calditrichota bacterium]NOG46383.1 putative lipid II flippase FtsW [Calditrichota bacterium]